MHIVDRKLEINSKGYLSLMNYIKAAGGKVRLIGGIVRDTLLGISSADIDLATNLLPNEIIQIFKKLNIKVIPTGIKFGTVTVLFKEETFEITTLRKDIFCDGRWANVVFTDNFYIDAARRDFTINALSYCPFECKIYDYFTGLNDLVSRRVVFIGKAEERIKEDFLRILRFFRFSARFAESIDKAGLLACETHRTSLKKLSKERIKSEMDRLLEKESKLEILQVMFDKKILEEIFPIHQLEKGNIHSAFLMAGKLNVELTTFTIYALLFRNIVSLNKELLLSLKYSRSEANSILSLIKVGKILSEEDLLIELKRLWLEDKDFAQYFIWAAIFSKDEQKILELYKNLQYKEKVIFPVNGTDIIKKIGYSGKEIGKITLYLKKAWLSADFSLDKNELIGLIDDYNK